MLNIKDLSSPELHEQSTYEQAFKLALEAFLRKDPGRVADKAAAEFVDRCLIVPHLDRRIVFDVDSHRFSFMETDQEAPVWLAILTLHYVNNADGGHPTGRLKHFREFKEGHFYEPAFNRRTRDVLVSAFGDNPDCQRFRRQP
jgi:hypothetical protein